MRRSSRSARSTLALVFIIIFLDILGLTVLSPVLAYIVRRYSPAALAQTLMTVACPGARFLAAPLLGRSGLPRASEFGAHPREKEPGGGA